jgi:hypothetical protein
VGHWISRLNAGESTRSWAHRIGEFWSYPESRTFAELLIDCEEDQTLRAVLVRMLPEDDTERRLNTEGSERAGQNEVAGESKRPR